MSLGQRSGGTRAECPRTAKGQRGTRSGANERRQGRSHPAPVPALVLGFQPLCLRMGRCCKGRTGVRCCKML